MSNSLENKIKRNKEKEYLKEMTKRYGSKPKSICPNCHKKSIFLKNDKGEIFCIRCEKIVKKIQ